MKKLIIIGANNFQTPLIKKAREMGHETHVFAWEEGAVGKNFADFFYPVSIVEKETILKYARKIQPDGIISIGSDLAMHTVNFLSNQLGIVGNSLQCTKVTTHKYLMRKALSSNGLPCPGFKIVKNIKDIDDMNLQYPLIVKPTDRSGSRGVTKVLTQEMLQPAVERAFYESFNKEIIIEEFISGNEYSVEMLSWKGNHHFLQITEKETSGPPYFVERAQHQPANLNSEVKRKLIEITTHSLSALQVEYGASHSEFIITPENEIYITEIGARMGGDYIGSDLVQLSTGFDFLKATINVALGQFEEINITEHNCSGVIFVFPKPGIVTKILNSSGKYQEIIRSEIIANVGEIIPEIKESSQRPACYIYKSNAKLHIGNNDIIRIITE